MILSAELEKDIADSGARLAVGYPWWLRPLLGRGVAGIALGRRIYLAAGVETSPPEAIARLLRHELVHVRQAARLGLTRFLWRYLTEYIRNLRSGLSPEESYRAISFEREAAAEEEGPAGG